MAGEVIPMTSAASPHGPMTSPLSRGAVTASSIAVCSTQSPQGRTDLKYLAEFQGVNSVQNGRQPGAIGLVIKTDGHQGHCVGNAQPLLETPPHQLSVARRDQKARAWERV